MRLALRRSWTRSVALAILVAAGVTVPVASAGAQGLLDFLFGPAKSKASVAPTSPRPIEPARLRAFRDPYEPDRARDRDITVDDGTGSYTTYCVRLCDGYFWPMHHKVHRRDFQRDARHCESTCGEQTRLFYGPAHSKEGIEGATDLQGKTYDKLPTAFFYRKTLINGCACRPSPWSSAEMARHEEYRVADERARRAAEERVAATKAPTDEPKAEATPGSEPPAVRVAEAQDPDANGVASGVGPRAAAPIRPQGSPKTRPRATEPAKSAPPKPVAVAQSAPPKTKPFALGGSGLVWPGDKTR